MSSGHGINSKQGRCYPFWTEVALCREQPASTPEKCAKYVEDFMECLFHKKEKRKLVEMIKALEGGYDKDNSSSSSEINSDSKQK